jgi:general secretion pathway protein D
MRRWLVFLSVVLAACASEPVHETDAARRIEGARAIELQVAQLLAQAEALRQRNDPQAAIEAYERVEQLQPGNARARAGLAAVAAGQRHREAVAEAEQLLRAGKAEEAGSRLRAVLAEDPAHREARRLQRAVEEKTAQPVIPPLRLRPPADKPVSLDLRDMPVRAVFDIVGRTVGVSFVFDRDVRADQRASITVRDAALEDVMRLLLATNQLDQKVVNPTTALIYPNTPQKQREYQELLLKVFYLGNADVKQTANMLRTMLRMREVFVDEKLGMVVIRDTPKMVQLAERLVAAHDLAEPEVMLEVEVLEVASNRLVELGLKFPEAFAVGLAGAGGPGTLTLQEWRTGGSELVQLSFSDPLFLLLLRQQDGATSVLANPRIRVRNREKARVHIGDRVPVITTTAATGGGFLSESVTYLDVGLKLEVEPLIHLEDEVAIKVGLEVSNIAREVRSVGSNTLTYQIGTRNAATTLRIRDGETQVLAGLISDEDRRSASRVPGLGELPVIGRLFSQTRDSLNKTEIVLLITPRLVRTLARPPLAGMEFAAGTDSAAGIGAAGGAQAALPPREPPREPAAAPPPPLPPGTSVSPFPPGSPLAPPGMVPFGGPQPAR